MAVDAVEPHIEASLRQGPRLTFFACFAPDELIDVGMVDIEHDHLGGPSSLAAGLDRASRGICAAHETDWTTWRPTALHGLAARTDPTQVDSRTRASLKDHTFFDVPVEDRLHVVLDSEDEAR